GDFITYGRHILGDAEVRTPDDRRRVETRCLRLDHPLDFEDTNLCVLGIERHRPGYAVDGEVAGYFETVLACLFNLCARERNRRILGCVEEIWAFQRLVELRHMSVQTLQR